MALIVISTPICFEAESSLINQLFDAGMTVFHLRKPGVNKLSYKALLAKIDTQHHDKIALHQFHELRTIFPGIRRLHYPEQLRKTNFYNDYKNIENYILSTSIHQLNNFRTLRDFDYTFYGPVFNSISKNGYSGLSKDNLVLPDPPRKTKLIGLGGIIAENIPLVKQMGFDGIAVLGSLWNNKVELIKEFNSLKIKHKIHFN